MLEVKTVSVTPDSIFRHRRVDSAGTVTRATGTTTPAAADSFVEDRRAVRGEISWYIDTVHRSTVGHHIGSEEGMLCIHRK